MKEYIVDINFKANTPKGESSHTLTLSISATNRYEAMLNAGGMFNNYVEKYFKYEPYAIELSVESERVIENKED